MSPYTYRRRKAAPAGFLDQAASLFNEVIEARVSTAIAMAAVILAAGSAMAVTAMASPDIAMGQPDGPMAKVAMAYPHSQVLGDSTSVIDDSALEAGDPTGDLSAKSASFDSTLGRWGYNVTYKVGNLNGSASLYIGTYAVQTSITSSGTAETGSILKPSTHYVASLWAIDSTGAKVRLAKVDIRTPKAKVSSSSDKTGDSEKCIPPVQPDGSVSGSTTSSTSVSGLAAPSFCIKDESGAVHCQRPHCLVPPLSGTNASGTPPAASGTPGAVPPSHGRSQPQAGGQ